MWRISSMVVRKFAAFVGADLTYAPSCTSSDTQVSALHGCGIGFD